jgi:hypothetical protein
MSQCCFYRLSVQLCNVLQGFPSVLNYCRCFAHLVEMSKKRKHSSYSLKYKLELLLYKRTIYKCVSYSILSIFVWINKNVSYDFCFLHPVRINRNFGLARLYCIWNIHVEETSSCSRSDMSDSMSTKGSLRERWLFRGAITWAEKS